jgi:hypothetical protein
MASTALFIILELVINTCNWLVLYVSFTRISIAIYLNASSFAQVLLRDVSASKAKDVIELDEAASKLCPVPSHENVHLGTSKIYGVDVYKCPQGDSILSPRNIQFSSRQH